MKKYYFTFGHGQSPGFGYYLIIEAENSDSAREKMCERWGVKWSMIYSSAGAAGVERCNLKEVKAYDRSQWDNAFEII